MGLIISQANRAVYEFRNFGVVSLEGHNLQKNYSSRFLNKVSRLLTLHSCIEVFHCVPQGTHAITIIITTNAIAIHVM